MSERILVAAGVTQLDHLLGGLFIGENVVWYDDAGSLASVFCRNFLQASQAENKPIIYVSFDRSPKILMEKLGPLSAYDHLTVLDCFTNGKGASSPVFLRFYEDGRPKPGRRVIRVDEPRDIDRVNEVLYGVHAGLSGDVRLVFESLTGMQELWGGEENLIKFYAHACPRLYELETVAYWIMEKDAHTSRLKAQITQIAQVVIELTIKRGTTSLTILKAENRDIENLHQPHHYWVKGLEIGFETEKRTAAGLDLGQRLRELRTRKGLSQTELARLVGVTPSTISQVESNLIYPSMPALLKMAEVLSVDVPSFFKEQARRKNQLLFTPEEAAGLRLPGLPEESGRAWRLTPIDLETKAEPLLIEISPGASLSEHFFFHKGEEFGCLMDGELELKVEGAGFTLRPGDVIYLTSETPDQWRNPGTEPARLLWLKIK